MILRSSSTPVLGSLISSLSDSNPSRNVNNNLNNHHEAKSQCHLPPTIPHANHHKHNNKLLPFGTRNLPSVSCNSSPMSPSVSDHFSASRKGFRRVVSDGNLEGLAHACCNDEEVNNTDPNQQPQMLSRRSKSLMLETIPSFSYSSIRGRRENEEDEIDIEYEKEEEEYLERNIEKDSKMVMAMEGSEFSFKNGGGSMVLSKEAKATDKLWNTSFAGEKEVIGQEMNLARGLGLGGGGGVSGSGGGCGGSGDITSGSGGDGGDNHRVEEHYRRMVAENPANPLFLSNYARFLHQSKKDLGKAEEYYCRAILADPGDGDILSQYATLVWELHGDEDTASSYFERAIHASPQDSNVHASYARFLWETEEEEEDDDECKVPSDMDGMGKRLSAGALESTNV